MEGAAAVTAAAVKVTTGPAEEAATAGGAAAVMGSEAGGGLLASAGPEALVVPAASAGPQATEATAATAESAESGRLVPEVETLGERWVRVPGFPAVPDLAVPPVSMVRQARPVQVARQGPQGHPVQVVPSNSGIIVSPRISTHSHPARASPHGSDPHSRSRTHLHPNLERETRARLEVPSSCLATSPQCGRQ